MQKISFKIIEQAIANIPDDPGAWEKVLEIMNRDDFQDYWAPVKMQEDWGAMKYIKTKYQKARDVAYIAYVMASVPVYVFGYTDQETKEDDIAVFDVIDDFEMSEEDPFAPDFEFTCSSHAKKPKRHYMSLMPNGVQLSRFTAFRLRWS